MDGKQLEWERRKAREHPLRLAILEALAGSDMRATELRSRLPGQPSLSAVSYHLGVLHRLDLVEDSGSNFRLVGT